ncbi:MAG: hypothetical protein NW237_03775 [Cyanobacteriota bacterium]|nr:hypothetical protein [Cyanobacteriota bacterium]
MRPIQFIALLSLLMGVLVIFGIPSERIPTLAANPRIQLLTDPPLQQIRPFEAEATSEQYPVKFVLQALDQQGDLLQLARIHLVLQTPERNIWLPTDFPWAEGSQLLELEALNPVQFEQMLPIRGSYRLQITVKSPAESFQENLDFFVTEAPIKYVFLGILVIVLFGVGILGAWIIGDPAAGDGLSESVRLLLSGAAGVAIVVLLVINFKAGWAETHPAEMPISPTKQAPVMQAEGRELSLEGDPSAVVGQPLALTVKVRDLQTGQSLPDQDLEIRSTQLEHGWTAFAYQGSADLTWQQHFFDGAPHRIAARIPSSPLQVSQIIEVEGIAPPLSIRLIVMSYLLGILTLGMGAGFWIRRALLRSAN